MTPLNGLRKLKIRARPHLPNLILLTYPSFNYARKYIETTEEQYEIILACRKTILKNNGYMWVKTGSENFDVPMRGYDCTNSGPCRSIY